MKKRKDTMGGFTLIELMIVILIIAILVAIAVPVFLSARANAQRRTCQANLRTIDGLSNVVYTEFEHYPEFDAFFTKPAPIGFVKKEPKCPSAGGDSYFWNISAFPYEAECPLLVDPHTYP